MKYLTKTIEYGLYFLVFFLPVQTRWIIKAGELEYATYSLYATDILLIIILILYIIVIFTAYSWIVNADCPKITVIPVKTGIQKKYLAKVKFFLDSCLRRNDEFMSSRTVWTTGQAHNDKKELTSRGNRMVWFFIIGLVLTSAVSVFFAVDRPLAFFKLGWLALGAGLFWLIAEANYSRVKLVWSLFFGLVFQASLAIWQFLSQTSFKSKWLGLAWHNAADLGASVIETAGPDGAGERWLRAYGGLDHPNVLGGVLAVGILLLVGITNYELRITDKRQNAKFIKFFTFYFLLIIFTAALFFSFSRAAWLALAAGLIAALSGAVRKKNLLAQKNILQAVLISGLVGFILFFQFSNLVVVRVSGHERLEVKSVNERLESLKNSWPIIKNNWLTGVGLGNYTLALSRQAPGQESFYYQPAHNVFLLVWSEVGILGLIFFIGLLFIMARYNKTAILIALTVIMTIDHWLWSLHFGVLFFWLILGIMVSSDKK